MKKNLDKSARQVPWEGTSIFLGSTKTETHKSEMRRVLTLPLQLTLLSDGQMLSNYGSTAATAAAELRYCCVSYESTHTAIMEEPQLYLRVGSRL